MDGEGERGPGAGEPLGDAGAEGAGGTDDDEDFAGEIDHADIVFAPPVCAR